MKRVLVAATLGGLLLVGTPTLALSAQRNDTRAEKSGDRADKGNRGDKGDRAHRGDRGDRDRHRGDRDRHRHRHGDRDYYYDYYYGYPYYGGGYYGHHPYYGGYHGDPYYGGSYAGARGRDILIRGMAFNPPESHIRPGEDVTWVFSDREPHTVTADNKSFDSGTRKDGEFRLRFDQPGTYSYHCALHPDMKGRVIVG